MVEFSAHNVNVSISEGLFANSWFRCRVVETLFLKYLKTESKSNN
jgi:hypothetical protein